MDRRKFFAGCSIILTSEKFFGRELAPVEAQSASAQGSAPEHVLATLASGTFKPGPAKPPTGPKVGHTYLSGMLSAGNLRLEMHETIQQVGAVHEAVGVHLHNEIWCVQRGTATLWINGVEHTMEAGDVGLVCAGDQHWIGNKGPGELAYFVVTVGPPE